MKHFGDITKLSGYTLPIVDVITGGSPCQDLSVAGKRAGLAGERSGLFMEQMRIVKEMRECDRKSGRTAWMVRPRYMVWENVDGARTSPGGNRKGADFAAVIEEIIKVAEPGANVCVCVPDGGWTKSGCYYAEDGSWSIAWRVHDAQFWGVPQRRKRIALVADFGGLSAPEILFERKGLSGDLEPRREAGQETAGAVGGGVEGASGTISFQERGGKPGGGKGILIQHEHVGALSTLNNQSVLSFDPSMSRYAGTVFKDVAKTLTPGTSPGHHDAICTKEPILLESNQNHATVQTDGISTTLPASMGMGGGYVPMITAYGISSYDSNAMKSPNPHSGIYEADTARTLDLNGGSPACNQGGIAVVQSVGCDVYNQEVTGEVAAYLTAASGGTNTSGPKVIAINGEIAGTLDANYYKGCGERQGVEREVVCVGNGQLNQISMAEQANTLDTMHDQQAVMVALRLDNCSAAPIGGVEVSPTIRQGAGPNGCANVAIAAVDCRNGTENSDINGTLQAKSTGGIGVNFQNVCRTGSVVRRLTPLECERLQGYPDGWTDIGDWVDSKGKKHKDADSPRYKALGNSIALPFWQWLAKRISAQYERTPTMASLFDGIGGFPLVFSRCGATPVWASEIEEFPIAVTKVRFPDESV